MSAPTQKNILPWLKTCSFGRRMVYEKCVPSSNRSVLELAGTGETEGLLVVAESQTAGRGRQQRNWFSPPDKNLYFSLLLRPTVQPVRLPELALLMALGLRKGILSLLPDLPIGLKWPNDLWIDGHKISGILCESEKHPSLGLQVVVGIGLNVNCTAKDFPPELQKIASSLQIAAGAPLDRAHLLAAILNHLEEYYQRWQQEKDLLPFLPEWEQADILKGKLITITQPTRTITGTVLGLAPDGRLHMQLEDLSQTLISCGDTAV